MLAVTEGLGQTIVNSYRRYITNKCKQLQKVHDKQMLTVIEGTGQTNVNSYRRSRTNKR